MKLCEYYNPPKKIYVDRLDAHIAFCMSQLTKNPTIKRYYFHAFCQGWHLTSQSYRD